MTNGESEKNNRTLPVLTRIMHMHAEETITDEQVKRILDPVIEMILAGDFCIPASSQ